MEVDDFDSIRAGSRPDEADAELVVDAVAVQAFAITSQGLQPVARRNMQVVQTDRNLQLPELAACHAPRAQRTGTGAKPSAGSITRG